jgi:hypothetical protein
VRYRRDLALYDPGDPNAKRPEQPRALTLANMLGENYLLVAGGILDQPAGLLFMARQAAYLNGLLDSEARATKESPVDSLLSQDQLRDLLRLQKLRVEMSQGS